MLENIESEFLIFDCKNLGLLDMAISYSLIFNWGIEKQKTAPPVFSFSAHISPPWASTISWQMASPSPVPPAPVLVVLLWLNLSNTVLSGFGNARSFVGHAET